MRERIESKHVTKEIKSQMPVIPVEIVKERGCTFCPYYLGNYEKQPRCMMKKKVLLHADCHRELHYSKNVDELVLLTQGL